MKAKSEKLVALAELMLNTKTSSYTDISNTPSSKLRTIARYARKEYTKRGNYLKFDIYQSERKYLNFKIFFVLLLAQAYPISKK